MSEDTRTVRIKNRILYGLRQRHLGTIPELRNDQAALNLRHIAYHIRRGDEQVRQIG